MKSALSAMFVLATACSTALAQPDAAPRAPGIESSGYVWNQPDPDKDAALAHRPDIEQGKIAYEICQGCHQSDGSGRADAIYPSLAGQHASVLIKQMMDVRAGRRDNPKMHPFVGEWVVSVEEVANIAAYLNQLPISLDNGKGSGNRLERGRELYENDCASCHGKNGEGNATEFYPLVAHQHYAYLYKEAVMIRDGERRNANPKMVIFIRDYSNEDLKAVSDYMSRLTLPAGTRQP
ncbi:c-type cytochrome [Thauera linaloolentis]|uniref:Cytochrome c553 n=1 Tax=Thauera linaloolentis (strain DSM 12138 / JCM 21573 / CCUG 41526 / CIP 105981 / IAM 15112 / NBRC 102519 / 47Lol) TaxID=1123367 RepID=N6YXM3_THAL4|nr:c-type cytochrome [Thauera linaloolentis]ENO87162.1 cytochrome c553 [Thauera linaloolentis 47Lol = DSM 12138]MCM8566429.1 c-type cytochrome [Thauera linaloolentis]